jgi:hypothetical protein
MFKDPLDAKIEALRQEVAAARAKLLSLETTLRAYEDAAQLRPSAPEVRHRQISSTPRAEADTRRGGRQVGAISQKWRQILRLLAINYPNGATDDDIASFGPGVGLTNLRPRDVRQQATKYIEHGYLEQVRDNRYRVTDAALARFGFAEAHAEHATLDNNERIAAE